ncbi:MAG: hypothetical protein NTX35_22115 [Verrucomicrobia bacterium]|nr:hypothetical protein [Verrucomicrobiota bacterium]
MSFFLAAKLSTAEMVSYGVISMSVIMIWAYSNWRAAVKVAFVIALLEGAIRKWLLPGGQEMVYFLKDIFLVGAYLKFFMAPDPELRAYRLNVPTSLICVLGATLLPAVLNPNIGSMMLALYGLKIYLFYIPLLFIMPFLFRTEREMNQQMTWYALIAIPICLLGAAQFAAGSGSPLNVYAQSSAEGISGFGFGEKVRITGTFSYITGHMTFIVFFTALSFALLAQSQTRWKWLLMGGVLPLLAGNALMNGSRSSIYLIGFVLIGFTLASVSGKLGSNKSFTAMLLTGVAVCVLAGAYFFYEAFQNLSTRAKVSDDNVYTRAVEHPLAALEQSLSDAGLGGYGIGMCHPASEGIRRALKIPAPKMRAPVYDMELGQVVVELGPLIAVGWYLLRFVCVFTVWSAYWACKNVFQKPILLMAALLNLPYLLLGVVYNHTANMLLFGITGLAFVSLLEPTVKRRFPQGRRQLAAPDTSKDPLLEGAPAK